MVMYSCSVKALRRAEEELFATGLSWWRSWQDRHKLQAPTTPTTFEHRDVSTGPDKKVHMVSCVAKTAKTADANATPLVCLHGYGHGTSVFYASLAPLAEKWGAPVYALDSPGCGLSSRPPYRHEDDPEKGRQEAENFFVEELEAWREAMGIERMVLAGHSIGGYCAFAYAERYPSRIERLVLISPAGVGRPSEGFAERVADMPAFFRVAFSLWDRGFSPLSLVRWGPGRWLVNRYVSRRTFEHTWSNAEQYAEYMYRNHTAGNASWGGHAHHTLLMPGAYARSPIYDRIGALDMRVTFVYGTSDWMDNGAAEDVRDGLPGMKRRVEVCHVAGAGHNVPLDNPLGVVDAILSSGHAGMLDGRTVGGDAMRKERAWLAERLQPEEAKFA